MATFLDAFVQHNVRCSNWIELRLPKAFVTQLKVAHQNLAKDALGKGGLVLDIGAGFISAFARDRHPAFVVGIDIDADQIARNRDVDAGLVATAYRLPICDGIVDVVVTHTLIEHLSNTDAFMREVARILRPGGSAIHIFPGKLSPFAILNCILPESVKRRLLLLAFPDLQGLLGFPAFYDRCTEPHMRQLLRNLGFDIVESRTYYYQSLYYKVFLPIYLVGLIYDLLVWRLDIKMLASQILIEAVRR